MNWRSIRYPLVIFLIALIPLGIYNIVRNVRTEFHNIDVQSDLYHRSPGCDSRAENIDPTLSPCTDAPMTVVDVATHSESSRSYGRVTVYDLTTRDQWGNQFTYPRVGENFAAARRPGEVITAQYWRGRVHALSSGQDHCYVEGMTPQTTRNFTVMFIWLVISGAIAPALIRLICVFWDRAPYDPYY